MANKDQRVIQTPAGKVGMETWISFAVRKADAQRLKEVAKAREISRSELLRQMVAQYLKMEGEVN